MKTKIFALVLCVLGQAAFAQVTKKVLELPEFRNRFEPTGTGDGKFVDGGRSVTVAERIAAGVRRLVLVSSTPARRLGSTRR